MVSYIHQERGRRNMGMLKLLIADCNEDYRLALAEAL